MLSIILLRVIVLNIHMLSTVEVTAFGVMNVAAVNAFSLSAASVIVHE